MATIEHPYQDLRGGKWLKGNLHTHTARSDGDRSLQEVIDDYAGRGYDFLAITDHDIYTSAVDYEGFDNHGLVLIPGNEISANGPDMLHVNAQEIIEPYADRQQVLEAVATSGGLALFNHPNWGADFNYCPQSLLERCQGYAGLEIYNGVIGRLQGSPYASNRWDMLLTRGHSVWGFANDDSHIARDVGLGWNVVYAREISVAGIVEALTQGRFYASTGVVIKDIHVEGMRIVIETENAARIVALCDGAVRFAQVDDQAIEVEAPSDATYVRFECWGTGERFAWTQPFFIRAADRTNNERT